MQALHRKLDVLVRILP